MGGVKQNEAERRVDHLSPQHRAGPHRKLISVAGLAHHPCSGTPSAVRYQQGDTSRQTSREE